MLAAHRDNGATKGIIQIKGTPKSFLTTNTHEGPQKTLSVAPERVEPS